MILSGSNNYQKKGGKPPAIFSIWLYLAWTSIVVGYEFDPKPVGITEAKEQKLIHISPIFCIFFLVFHKLQWKTFYFFIYTLDLFTIQNDPEFSSFTDDRILYSYGHDYDKQKNRKKMLFKPFSRPALISPTFFSLTSLAQSFFEVEVITNFMQFLAFWTKAHYCGVVYFLSV